MVARLVFAGTVWQANVLSAWKSSANGFHRVTNQTNPSEACFGATATTKALYGFQEQSPPAVTGWPRCCFASFGNALATPVLAIFTAARKAAAAWHY
jgi:hypothetical protein